MGGRGRGEVVQFLLSILLGGGSGGKNSAWGKDIIDVFRE